MKTKRTAIILSETGQSLVEFAMVAPVLLLVTLAILDLGRLVFINTMLSAAAQEGARTATVSTNATEIQSTVETMLNGVDRNAVEISIDRTEDHVEVELVYDFQPITPLIGFFLDEGEITLRRAARMQLIGVFFDP